MGINFKVNTTTHILGNKYNFYGFFVLFCDMVYLLTQTDFELRIILCQPSKF